MHNLIDTARSLGFAISITAEDAGYSIEFAQDADTLDIPGFDNQITWTTFEGDDLDALVRSAHLFLDQFGEVAS